MEKPTRNARVAPPGGGKAGNGRAGKQRERGGRGGRGSGGHPEYTPTQDSTATKDSSRPARAAASGFTAEGRRVMLATTDTGVDTYALRQSPPLLLSDEDVRRFIMEGYLILQPSALPASFHDHLYARINGLNSRRKDNEGNNILPVIPELELVFEDPTIRGALQSIMGPDYMLHPHRHCHDRRPGAPAQEWHKDSYWGFTTQRHHYPRWTMAMYYPQDTSLELGPTGLLPGTQYYSLPNERDRHLKTNEIPAAWKTFEYPAVCPAGTVVLIHYDLWHAGLENYSSDPTRPRYMFKFQFTRMQEPTAASWHIDSDTELSPWIAETHSSGKTLTPLYQHIWDWMCGRKVDSSNREWLSEQQKQRALSALFNTAVEGEPERLGAAYELAQKGESDSLIEGLHSEKEPVVRSCAYGLIAAARYDPQAAVSAAIDILKRHDKVVTSIARTYAAFILGEIGTHASIEPFKQLLPGIKDFSTRRAVATALGNIGNPGKEDVIVPVLLQLLQDEDAQTKFQAMLSLAKIAGSLSSPLTSSVLPSIANSIYDNNRYVEAYALEALKRMRASPEAQDLLVRTLLSQRWCPITTKSSAF